jgi:hypothetical protein
MSSLNEQEESKGPTTLDALETERRRDFITKVEKQKRQEEYNKAVKLNMQSRHHIARDNQGKVSTDYYALTSQRDSMPALTREQKPDIPTITLPSNIPSFTRNEEGNLIDGDGNKIDEKTGQIIGASKSQKEIEEASAAAAAATIVDKELIKHRDKNSRVLLEKIGIDSDNPTQIPGQQQQQQQQQQEEESR